MTKPGHLKIPDDLRALTFLARFGVAHVGQVHAQSFPDLSVRTAYRRLEVLEQHGLVAQRRTLWRRPGVFWATRKGIELCGEDLPPYRFNQTLLAHTVELVNLFSEIDADPEPYLRYRPEREIRAERSSRPLPDALVAFEPNRWTALELELTNKRAVRYRQSLRDYAECEDVHYVRYYFASREGARRSSGIAAEVAREYGLHSSHFSYYAYRPEGLLSEGSLAYPPRGRVTYLGSAGSGF